VVCGGEDAEVEVGEAEEGLEEGVVRLNSGSTAGENNWAIPAT
jgi:hypothetical protein